MKRLLCLLLAAAPGVVLAAGGGPVFDPHLDLRLRYENVDQDGFANDAEALTLRSRLGLGFQFSDEWSGLVEFEDIRDVGIDNYNSTANGSTQYPVIADPEDTELNQAYLDWRPNETAGFRVGRQRIILDNARFVGNVGFRQNEQTFDAAGFRYAFSPDLEMNLVHVEQVNRIFGDSHPNPALAETDVNSQLFNLGWKTGSMKLVGYAYLIDNEDAPSTSTETYGLRWTGSHEMNAGTLKGAAEFASQDPYEDGAAVTEADYWMLQAGYHGEWVGVDLAQETLEGNGQYGFSTPLATLHAFQGWADVFLATPPDGIEDRFAKLSGSYRKLQWQAVFHDFSANRGDADYGTELDLSVSHPLGWGINGKLEYADYNSDGFAADTRKFWITLGRSW